MPTATTAPSTLQIAITVFLLVVVLGLGVWFIIHRIRRSEDPTRILVKTIATLIIIVLCGYALFSGTGFSVGGAFIVPFVCVFLGVVGSIIWAPHIGAVLAKPITAMFDGGNQELEPQPLYSICIAKRKAGKYQEAVYGILEQLEKFPNDVTGQLMLAEIQAENLNDLPAAELTIERFCSQPNHAPENIAIALNSLADWHLKYAQDKQAARADLEKIVELLPDTEQAVLAQQRIGRLGASGALISPHNQPDIPMQIGVQNVGLMKDSSVLRKPDEDPAKLAAEYVKHLEQYPQDSEAREKLAGLYADYYQRFDLGIMQLDDLVQTPNQPAKQVVRWLNLMADMQVRSGADYDTIKKTLERIIDLYPARAYAENARQRIDRLKLEIKGKETSQAVQLGSYEQNIGLKKGLTWPHRGARGGSEVPGSQS